MKSCGGFASLVKNSLAESFGGKKRVKGNLQGFLSRSITRRSDQNCKIILQILILQFCRQLVKKVLLDFFDKLRIPRRLCLRGIPAYSHSPKDFFVGTRRFSAALLCVTQGKTPQFRRKRLGEGLWFLMRTQQKPIAYFIPRRRRRTSCMEQS